MMSGAVGLAWHDRYLGRGFVPRRASWSRYALALQAFDDAGLFRQGLAPFPPPPAGGGEAPTGASASYPPLPRGPGTRGAGPGAGRPRPAAPRPVVPAPGAGRGT